MGPSRATTNCIASKPCHPLSLDGRYSTTASTNDLDPSLSPCSRRHARGCNR
jgi:hypothetical protein